MRITNHMIYGNALNNIFRNARHINQMVTQLETGKRIQRPSDDPLISARTMRYRTILAENERFQMNTQSALAWMEVSESVFSNMLNGNDSIFQVMNDQFVRGATGTLDIDDQRAIMETIRQKFFQLSQVEMNQTFEGRYVFSGFHTDQPPVLTHDMPHATFQITQRFSPRDVQELLCTQRFNVTNLPEVHERVHVMQLPYRNGIDVGPFATGAPPVAGPVASNITLPEPFIVHARSLSDPYAYQPPAPVAGPPPVRTVHFIPETGELIFNQEDLSHIPENFDVQYTRTGFNRGELNPAVYFRSTQLAGPPLVPSGTPTVDLAQEARVTNATPLPSGAILPAGTVLQAGTILPSPVTLPNGDVIPAGVVERNRTLPMGGTLPAGTTVGAGQILPRGTEVAFNTVIGEFDVAGQRIHLEFSGNVYIPINSFAKDILTPQMFGELKRLIEFADSLVSSDPSIIRASLEAPPPTGQGLTGEDLNNAVTEFLTHENQRFSYLMHDRFNNMMERHFQNMTTAQTQHTNLGTRMARLDMLQHRLEEDHVHYTALLSDTEDTDISGTIMRLNGAQAAFGDSLRATGITTQLSLANFINR